MWKKKKRKDGEVIPEIIKDDLDTEDLLILDDMIGDDEDETDGDIYGDDTEEGEGEGFDEYGEDDEELDEDDEEWLF